MAKQAQALESCCRRVFKFVLKLFKVFKGARNVPRGSFAAQ